MQPAGPRQGPMIVGGGRLTADPGIHLGSETWLHSVFVCPLHKDPCVSVTEFAETTSLVQSDISVPGTTDPKKKVVARARPCLLRLLTQWYEVTWRLRRAGFTLRGNFSPDNVVVYQPKLQQVRKRGRGRARAQLRRPSEDRLVVRMTGHLHLSRYSPDDAMEDDRTFVWSVRQILMLREKKMPREIGDWLNLINSRGVGCEYLVRYHIHLMDPRAGLAVLMSLRRRLNYLRRRMPDVYSSIIFMMSNFQDWNSKVGHLSNALMEAAALFTLKRTGKTLQEGFEPNANGILKVIRDCSEHPAKRFEQFMLLILDQDFEDFTALLQFVMFCAGQLPFLHLENS